MTRSRTTVLLCAAGAAGGFLAAGGDPRGVPVALLVGGAFGLAAYSARQRAIAGTRDLRNQPAGSCAARVAAARSELRTYLLRAVAFFLIGVVVVRVTMDRVEWGAIAVLALPGVAMLALYFAVPLLLRRG